MYKYVLRAANFKVKEIRFNNICSTFPLPTTGKTVQGMGRNFFFKGHPVNILGFVKLGTVSVVINSQESSSKQYLDNECGLVTQQYLQTLKFNLI